MESGLRFGANFYHSGLPGGQEGGTSGGTNGPVGDEWIYGGHLVFNNPSIEFLAEYDRISHKYSGTTSSAQNGDGSYTFNGNSDGSTSTTMNAFYVQAGYHLGLLTPYVRFELNGTDHPDAYLTTMLETTRYYTAGARYELTSASALKFELVKQKSDHVDDWSSTLNWSMGW